jgi:protein-disulfide isomerase
VSCHLVYRVFACYLVGLIAVHGESPAAASDVATVNGETITAAQLDRALRPQLQAMEERVRQMRQAALDKLIDNVLLEQAASSQGITVDQYLQTHVESITVPSADIDRAYEGSRDEFPGVLPAEAKYRIRRTMEDNARAAALTRLLLTLREKAQVTNRLASDAMATLNAAAQEGPSSGNPDAPVTIVEFSDFECPYCRAAQPVLKAIMERWPGRVRHVFKHFPLDRHPHAMQAARAAVCADRQDRFWAMHDTIFAGADELSETSLRAAAGGAGLRIEEFDNCMRSEEPADHVRKDMLVGRTAGVTGTPAFFVNGELVPAAALESAIERSLGGSR